MTKEKRRKAALRYAHLIKNNVHMKAARLMLIKEFSYPGTYDAWKRSLFNYCKEFGVPTS